MAQGKPWTQGWLGLYSLEGRDPGAWQSAFCQTWPGWQGTGNSASQARRHEENGGPVACKAQHSPRTEA